MTFTPRQWTMAFTTALATHALAALLLPQVPPSDRKNGDPPLPTPNPVLVSLASPSEPTLPVPPPAPAPYSPPVARQSEPAPPAAAEFVEPQPVQSAPAPATAKQSPFPQQSGAAIHSPPVAKLEATARQQPTSVSNDETPNATETPSPSTSTATLPSVPGDGDAAAVDPALLRNQYGKAAHQWLNRHKRYPHRAQRRGDQGTVLVTFVVNRHGEVLHSSLKRSSGHPLLDKEALDLIQRAQPLPVFPDHLAEVEDTLTIVVPIPFQLR